MKYEYKVVDLKCVNKKCCNYNVEINAEIDYPNIVCHFCGKRLVEVWYEKRKND